MTKKIISESKKSQLQLMLESQGWTFVENRYCSLTPDGDHPAGFGVVYAFCDARRVHEEMLLDSYKKQEGVTDVRLEPAFDGRRRLPREHVAVYVKREKEGE